MGEGSTRRGDMEPVRACCSLLHQAPVGRPALPLCGSGRGRTVQVTAFQAQVTAAALVKQRMSQQLVQATASRRCSLLLLQLSRHHKPCCHPPACRCARCCPLGLLGCRCFQQASGQGRAEQRIDDNALLSALLCSRCAGKLPAAAPPSANLHWLPRCRRAARRRRRVARCCCCSAALWQRHNAFLRLLPVDAPLHKWRVGGWKRGAASGARQDGVGKAGPPGSP